MAERVPAGIASELDLDALVGFGQEGAAVDRRPLVRHEPELVDLVPRGGFQAFDGEMPVLVVGGDEEGAAGVGLETSDRTQRVDQGRRRGDQGHGGAHPDVIVLEAFDLLPRQRLFLLRLQGFALETGDGLPHVALLEIEPAREAGERKEEGGGERADPADRAAAGGQGHGARRHAAGVWLRLGSRALGRGRRIGWSRGWDRGQNRSGAGRRRDGGRLHHDRSCRCRSGCRGLGRAGRTAGDRGEQPLLHFRIGHGGGQLIGDQPHDLYIEARQGFGILIATRLGGGGIGPPLQRLDRGVDHLVFPVRFLAHAWLTPGSYLAHKSCLISARSALRSFFIASSVRVFTVPRGRSVRAAISLCVNPS